MEEEHKCAGCGSSFEDKWREIEDKWRERKAQRLKRMVIIYKMSWYETDRCRRSHTDMYFAREIDTRWGQPNPLCRIEVISVPVGWFAHASAVENSKRHMAQEDYEECQEEELLFNNDIEYKDTFDLGK